MESRYARKLEELRADPEAALDYMLAAMPFIREYTLGTPAPAPDPGAEREAPRARAGAARQTALTAFLVEDAPTELQDRSEVLRRYMEQVEKQAPHVPPPRPVPRCRRRGGGLVGDSAHCCAACGQACLVNGAESQLVCPGCGVTVTYMENGVQNFTYDQISTQMQFTTCFAYNPQNHFSEWLKQLQAKQDTDIPDEVLEIMRHEFRQARAATQSSITPLRVRAYLKKHGLTKFYEHSNRICELLGGVPAPRLSEELVAQLKAMFLDAQAPFNKHKPATRKNFLSYSYTLYKFCELLGEDEYLKHFSLLKSAEKLYQQDQIWKKICGELDWEFIPSV